MAVKLTLLCLGLLLALAARPVAARPEGGHAHSFQHYHGPVEGDDKEVTWVDKKGKHHRDFAAPAQYEFAYGVQDHHTGDYHGQKELRDGKAVAGEYMVKEPDGNIRTVRYHADEDGFHATVHNSRGTEQHLGGGSRGNHEVVDNEDER